MSVPRQVLPGRFWMDTRRCTQRQFLMRPDPETNNNFLYCLAEAAARYEIDVLLPSALSNHHHTIFYDRHGRIIEFVEHFRTLRATRPRHFFRADGCMPAEVTLDLKLPAELGDPDVILRAVRGGVAAIEAEQAAFALPRAARFWAAAGFCGSPGVTRPPPSSPGAR